MKGKLVVTLMAVALLVLSTTMAASATGPGDADTTITITNATLEYGSMATSQILVTVVSQETDPKEVRGVEVHVSFDPTLLQVVDADGDPANGVQLTVESDLFDGILQIGQNLVDNEAGTIAFAVAQSEGTPVLNATNKAIATVAWEATGECPEEDVKTEVAVAGNTLMADPDGYSVEVDCAVSGSITIPTCFTAGCIEGYASIQGRHDYSGVSAAAGAYEAYTDANGYFKLEGLEAGTYDVLAEMYGYLDAMASGVEVVTGEECAVLDLSQSSAYTLWGGDVAPQPEPDNVIDIGDITYIASHFGGTDPTADVNADSVVNILDLTVTSANFGMTGPTLWLG